MVASGSFRSRRFRLIKAKKRSTIHRFGSSIRFRPYGSRFCNQWLCSGFWRSLLFRGARSACGFDDTFAGSCWCRCRTDRERPPCQSTRMQILVHHEKACARSAGLNGCAHPGRPRADDDDLVFGAQSPPRRECAASSWTKLHPDIPCAMLARHRHPVATSIRQLWRFWMPSTVSRLETDAHHESSAGRSVSRRHADWPDDRCRGVAIRHPRQRHRIEIMFGRIKDWRRCATRYDRCAHTFLSAITIAATCCYYLDQRVLSLDQRLSSAAAPACRHRMPPAPARSGPPRPCRR